MPAQESEARGHAAEARFDALDAGAETSEPGEPRRAVRHRQPCNHVADRPCGPEELRLPEPAGRVWHCRERAADTLKRGRGGVQSVQSRHEPRRVSGVCKGAHGTRSPRALLRAPLQKRMRGAQALLNTMNFK